MEKIKYNTDRKFTRRGFTTLVAGAATAALLGNNNHNQLEMLEIKRKIERKKFEDKIPPLDAKDIYTARLDKNSFDWSISRALKNGDIERYNKLVNDPRYQSARAAIDQNNQREKAIDTLTGNNHNFELQRQRVTMAIHLAFSVTLGIFFINKVREEIRIKEESKAVAESADRFIRSYRRPKS